MVWTCPDHPYHKLHPWRSGCLYTALPTIIPLDNAGGGNVFPMVINMVIYLFNSRQLLQQVIQPKGHTTVCPLDFWLPLFFRFFFLSSLFSSLWPNSLSLPLLLPVRYYKELWPVLFNAITACMESKGSFWPWDSASALTLTLSTKPQFFSSAVSRLTDCCTGIAGKPHVSGQPRLWWWKKLGLNLCILFITSLIYKIWDFYGLLLLAPQIKIHIKDLVDVVPDTCKANGFFLKWYFSVKGPWYLRCFIFYQLLPLHNCNYTTQHWPAPLVASLAFFHVPLYFTGYKRCTVVIWAKGISFDISTTMWV